MKILTALSDNISKNAPRWIHLLKQSATRLPTNLTVDPELVWAFKLRRNVLLDIIADRCTSNLILRLSESKRISLTYWDDYNQSQKPLLGVL